MFRRPASVLKIQLLSTARVSHANETLENTLCKSNMLLLKFSNIDRTNGRLMFSNRLNGNVFTILRLNVQVYGRKNVCLFSSISVVFSLLLGCETEKILILQRCSLFYFRVTDFTQQYVKRSKTVSS